MINLYEICRVSYLLFKLHYNVCLEENMPATSFICLYMCLRFFPQKTETLLKLLGKSMIKVPDAEKKKKKQQLGSARNSTIKNSFETPQKSEGDSFIRNICLLGFHLNPSFFFFFSCQNTETRPYTLVSLKKSYTIRHFVILLIP